MKDREKTKEQLLEELISLRRENRELKIKLAKTEKDYLYNKRLLDGLFKSTLTPLAVLDKDYNFIRVNEAYAKADEREPNDFPGNNHFDFYPSDAENIFHQVVETKKPYKAYARPFIYTDHPERGVTYWDWNLEPVLSGNGDIEMLIFSLNNVTERVLSEERFSKAFHASPVMKSIQRISDGMFIDVNEKFLEATGLKRDEVVGKTPAEIKKYAEMGNYNQIITLFNSDLVRDLEVTFMSKSGELHIGLLSTELIEVEGYKELLAATSDITKLRKLEKEILKLDMLNLIGEMASGISHEIRNPLTSVRGLLQLLGQKNECSKFKKYINLMIEELDRANLIITEFLSLAKDKRVELKESNLNAIIRSLYPLMQAEAIKADKMIKLNLTDVPKLMLDEKEIRQLILNLVKNGLEAMPASRTLIISTHVEKNMKKEEVVLAVKDEGSGIAPDVLEKMGQPFFTTKDYGTGLGLSICYSIAGRHNADIDVETGSNGTTFFVRFSV